MSKKNHQTADGGGNKGFTVHDRRYWATGEADETSAEIPRADRPSYVVDLEAKLEQAETRLREYINARKVEQSDLKDLRERLQREHSEELKRAKGVVVREILELLDDLERAENAARNGGSLESLIQGVSMVRDRMFAKLKDMGLERIVALNEKFDPEFHQAVSIRPCTPEQNGLVLDVVQDGFRIGEQVLRPAMVVVGKAADS
ncbi:MAG: nucleotide exchange factor GrpE [Deltaproteobacteria bacterium]|nr:nucleotide exchange factor GrpE [Deltaproteobacteria bacterium]